MKSRSTRSQKSSPRLKVRALDQDAFRLFTRAAGPMKHRRDKRRKQREQRDLREDLSSALSNND